MRHNGEKGQAILLVVLGMSIFMIGGIGLAIDGAQIYAHRQMAQAAADAAAQAGIMSIFDGTNGSGTHAFSTGASFTCTTTDLKTPCVYAAKNGFGGSADDTVTIDFPTSAPGVNLSGSDPVNLVKATVQRTLHTGLIRFLGPSTSLIKATATAAIADVVSPTPIIVTHPTLSGSFNSNGVNHLQICGGPIRSIQVNSTSATSLATDSNTTIDLSQAGPNGGPSCTGGTGADFGDNGGPATPNFTQSWGTLPGKYIQPASPILDPLANVAAPTATGLTVYATQAAGATSIAQGVNGCPAGGGSCNLYSPGVYQAGIQVKNETAVFKPGVYIMTDTGGTPNGFSNAANGNIVMSTGFADDARTGQGMLVYDTGTQTSAAGTATGGFSITANGTASMSGSCDTLTCNTFKGILFFEDRNAAAKTSVIGGGGTLALVGTIYISDSLSVMTAHPTQFQTLELHGNPGSGTQITGEIIVSKILLKGGGNIVMALNPNATLHIRQVALVK